MMQRRFFMEPQIYDRVFPHPGKDLYILTLAVLWISATWCNWLRTKFFDGQELGIKRSFKLWFRSAVSCSLASHGGPGRLSRGRSRRCCGPFFSIGDFLRPLGVLTRSRSQAAMTEAPNHCVRRSLMPHDGDTIVFDLGGASTISLISGELVINKNIAVIGPGADLLTVARRAGNA